MRWRSIRSASLEFREEGKGIRTGEGKASEGCYQCHEVCWKVHLEMIWRRWCLFGCSEPIWSWLEYRRREVWKREKRNVEFEVNLCRGGFGGNIATTAFIPYSYSVQSKCCQKRQDLLPPILCKYGSIWNWIWNLCLFNKRTGLRLALIFYVFLSFTFLCSDNNNRASQAV